MWITPKTDWQIRYDAAGYLAGDYVNAEDYNRIKNNLLELREMAAALFHGIPHVRVGDDKTYVDDYYADEWNLIEDGLQGIVDAISLWDYGEKTTFYDNGRFIDYVELNRIESAELDIYNKLINSIKGQLRLSFRLGQRSRDLRV